MEITPMCGLHDCKLRCEDGSDTDFLVMADQVPRYELREGQTFQVFEGPFLADLSKFSCPVADKALDELDDKDLDWVEYSREQDAITECASTWDFIVEVHATGNEDHKWEIRGA